MSANRSTFRTRWLRGLMVVFVVLVLWPVVAWVLAQLLIVRRPLPVADAIVVLSGAAAYKERTQLAAKLYSDHVATRLILTNDNLRGPWSSSEQRNPFYYERAIQELCAAGVPRERIEVIPEVVLNTYEEAQALRGYSKARGLRKLLIVTSAFHSRRALLIIEHAFNDDGIEIGLEPVLAGFQTPSTGTWWFYPSGWRMVVGEYLKIVQYRIRYAGAAMAVHIRNSSSSGVVSVLSEVSYLS